MDENTGALSVMSSLDRDIQSEYEFIVKATDSGKYSTCQPIISAISSNRKKTIFMSYLLVFSTYS